MEDAFRISGIGIFIVFFALIFISLTLSLIGKLFIRNEEKRASITSKSSDKIEEVIEDEVTLELIAVITAAVRVAYGPCTRIHSIGSIHHESQYKMQGRMSVMRSHKLK